MSKINRLAQPIRVGSRWGFIFALFVFAAVWSVPDIVRANQVKPNSKTEGGDKKKKGDKGIALADASDLIRKHIFALNPKMNPATQFPVREITPGPVWKRMRLQVFRTSTAAPVMSGETFVVHNKKVIHIGQGFGGYGVGSMEVVDLDKDNKPEMLFAYSWGSGLHRSRFALLRASGKTFETIEAPVAYFSGDWTLRRKNDQTVDLVSRHHLIGRVQLTKMKQGVKLDLILDAKLPAAIRKNIQ